MSLKVCENFVIDLNKYLKKNLNVQKYSSNNWLSCTVYTRYVRQQGQQPHPSPQGYSLLNWHSSRSALKSSGISATLKLHNHPNSRSPCQHYGPQLRDSFYIPALWYYQGDYLHCSMGNRFTERKTVLQASRTAKDKNIQSRFTKDRPRW